MGVEAYVLFDCVPGKPRDVVRALTQVAGVEMAHAVTGSYDVIALVRAESMAALGDLVNHQIHGAPGVVKATVNVVVREPAPGGPLGSRRGQRA